MTRELHQLAILAGAVLLAAPGMAQESAPAASQQQSQAWSDEAARLALAEAQSYDIRLGSAAGPRLKLADKPVLKWSNNGGCHHSRQHLCVDARRPAGSDRQHLQILHREGRVLRRVALIGRRTAGRHERQAVDLAAGTRPA